MILIFILGLVALRILYSVGEVYYERDWPRDTWKGLLIALGLLCIAISAFGQAVRIDIPLQTSGPSVPISGGPLPQALWVANAAAYLCTHPSTTLAACQAAPITTYTDSTEGTTCPTATPLVQLPGNTCTAATGTTANVGFWYGGGVFDYWIVSSYGTYGPFSGNSSNSTLPSSCGSPIGIPCGGTGATTAAGALTSLGAAALAGATFTGAVTFSGGGLAHAIVFPDPNAGAVYTASQVLSTFFSPMAGTVPAGGAGTYNGVAATSYCNLSTAATASTTFTFADGGTSFGTVVFAASGTTGTFTISSAKAIASGDKITLTAPATADATAAGLNCSLVFAY